MPDDPEELPSEPSPPEGARPGRMRRPTPLGLMGPSEEIDVPRANPLPSLRAVAFMLLFIGVALGLLWLLTR